MTRIIIRTIPSPQRAPYVAYLKKHLPQAEWYVDPRFDDPSVPSRLKSTLTFLDALRLAGDEPCVHMEDDVILTQQFTDKLEAAISERPGVIIQFFSMRRADLTVGSRWDRAFMMNQCFYLPTTYSRLIADYHPTWKHRNEWIGGYDQMMQDWMRERKEPYWIHCPSLVQHRYAKSVADPKRSPARQSLSFVDPIEDKAIYGYV